MTKDSVKEEKNPNPMIYLVPDLLEEICLGLPLKSILKFKTVSKQWRSILESTSFAERRMKLQKKRKILAAGGNRTESKFEGDEEMEMVYLHCHDVTRPWLMTCDGLVCMPVPGYVNVLNPSTGKSLRFPSGPDPVTANRYVDGHRYGSWREIFTAYWAMGFGKDKVNGIYKVVRMFFDPDHYCEILDVNIGEWRKSSPPPYLVDARRKSACVNGSIYWLDVLSFQILALDLHTEEFRDVPFHNLPSRPPSLAITDQLVNLDDRLAISTVHFRSWTLAIWTMDAQEERWSMTYSIRLSGRDLYRQPSSMNFRPVTVTKQGNLFFHDNENRLFKYYPKINLVRWISQDTWVISPFVENLVPFEHHNSVPITSGYQYGIQYLDEHERINEQEELVNQRVDNVSSSRISKVLRWIQLQTPTILLTTSVVSLVIFRHYRVLFRS